jgi:hypothetical protein
VLFARAILEYEGLTKDMQNMASKSTYKEQLETKDEPVAWEQFHEHMAGPNYVAAQRQWVGLTDEEIEQGHKDSWVTKQAFESACWWAEDKLRKKNT